MTKVGQYFEEEKVKYAKEQNVRLLVSMLESGRITEECCDKAL